MIYFRVTPDNGDCSDSKKMSWRQLFVDKILLDSQTKISENRKQVRGNRYNRKPRYPVLNRV